MSLTIPTALSRITCRISENLPVHLSQRSAWSFVLLRFKICFNFCAYIPAPTPPKCRYAYTHGIMYRHIMAPTHTQRAYARSQQKSAVGSLLVEERASTWSLESEETARDAAAWSADVPQSVDIDRLSVPAAKLDFTPE